MKYSIDNGQTYLEAPQGFRVIIDGVSLTDSDASAELHINATHEGLIFDVYCEKDGETHNLGTSSETFDEITARLAG